jgi:hypothetical protein
MHRFLDAIHIDPPYLKVRHVERYHRNPYQRLAASVGGSPLLYDPKKTLDMGLFMPGDRAHADVSVMP